MLFAKVIFAVSALFAYRVSSILGAAVAPREDKITTDYVKQIFSHLADGDTAGFFAYVVQDVNWTLANPSPTNKSTVINGLWNKTGIEDVFAQVHDAMAENFTLPLVEEPVVSDDRAVVELRTWSAEDRPPLAKNGIVYDCRYSWHLQFTGQNITGVRAYLDTAEVNKLLNATD